MRWFCYIPAFIFCQSLICPALAAEITTLSVIPFSSQQGEEQAWLGKGIADTLMRDLSEVNDLAILERHELQTFLTEMELHQSAFIDQDKAIRVGKVAKLEQVIFGNYSLKKNQIQINLVLVDLNTQDIILNGQISGDLNEIHKLISQLALDLIKRRKLPINTRSLANINFTPTDSIPATEHFYQAMDSYDQGEYSEAFAHFYAASEQDPKYWEAHLWMGKMLEFLEMDTLAISAFLSLYDNAPKQTEAYDALLFAALLMEKNNPAEAIEAYKTLAQMKPAIPHSIEAAFHLGKLHQEEKKYLESYNAYAQVDSYYKKETALKSTGRTRQSRFFHWLDALALSRDAIINMINIYPKLSKLSVKDLPESPRGLIVVSKDNPEYKEISFGDTESIFFEHKPHPNWREKFYAISVPDGYVATGIDMQVKGHLKQSSRNHSFTMRISPFPLPRNYHNTWLGVIYGQTAKPTTLKKHIPFYGKNQRILTLQFIESFSEINSWKFKLNLQSLEDIANKKAATDDVLADSSFFEGQLQSQLPLKEKPFSGIAQPLAKYWYAPRQTLALLNKYQDGLYMVSVKGELGGEQTDLVMSHSPRSQAWSKPARLGINSLSEDFAPKLLHAEDGSMQLFWISNRRGLGWEIWTSRFETKTKSWQIPNRIPLDLFAPVSTENINYQASNLLHYAVTQDKRGRWILAYHANKKSKFIFLVSEDTKDWKLIGEQRSKVRFYNPVLLEDKAGVFRLAAIGNDQLLHLWSSNNLKQWRKQNYKLRYSQNAASFAMHPMHLFSEASDQLLLLISDAGYGLQYARFNPDIAEPKLDLVKDIGLEAYAITAMDNNRYLIAQQKNDQIEFRRYQQFQTQAPDVNATNPMLYSEYMRDNSGNDWRRIYARMRVIQPDVTTVAVEPDGRVWWGIETGIMTLKDDDFFSADVTQGFFHHHVTDIVPCTNKIYFASKDLNKLVLGSATKTKRAYSFSSKIISQDASSITAIHCGHNETLYLGTEHGKLFSYKHHKTKLIDDFKDETITALMALKNDRQLWIGTASGKIYQTGDQLKQITLPKDIKGKILALATDNNNVVWTSVKGHGVFRFIDNNWSRYSDSPLSANSLYYSISIIWPDPIKGVWMMPDKQELSVGVIYSDGTNSTVFNSPDKKIIAPSGLAIDKQGNAWIGTAFNGLFNVQRQVQ